MVAVTDADGVAVMEAVAVGTTVPEDVINRLLLSVTVADTEVLTEAVVEGLALSVAVFVTVLVCEAVRVRQSPAIHSFSS